jgi:hypothetical protein
MKTRSKKIVTIIFALLANAVLCGCSNMSESIYDKNAGMNGSFEYVKSGLPVNWILYTPKTVPESDFDICIDSAEFKDGKQSLKFVVRGCTADGGWHSPGFCNQFPAKPGELYHVSFWIKNTGIDFHAQIGGMNAKKMKNDTIIKSKEKISDWQLYEYTYIVPEEMNAIRFEINILSPGTLWIDDIRIEKKQL